MATTLGVVLSLTIVLSVSKLGFAQMSQTVNNEDIPQCESNPTVWRNDNHTCPRRAVCADVFDTVKNWWGHGGRTTCREHRVLHNCLCEDEDTGERYTCPIDNDDNLLFSSRTQKSYTCRSRCDLPYCNNLNQQRGPNAAVSMVEQDPSFGDNNYYRMECRCPRHHQPSQRRGIQRAVYPYSSRYNYQTHQYTTLYRCRNMGRERFMIDPCSN